MVDLLGFQITRNNDKEKPAEAKQAFTVASPDDGTQTISAGGHYGQYMDMEVTAKNDIDLIVMGSQGASGLQEMFIGSNTEKVVRRSKIPVLVIKKEVDDFVVDNIIFASDFNKESKSTFHRVVHFAELFNAKVHLLYINTIHNFNTTKNIEERIAGFMKDLKAE